METHKEAEPKKKKPKTRAMAIVFAAAATAFSLHTCTPPDNRPPRTEARTQDESKSRPPPTPMVPGCVPAGFEPVQKPKSPSEELLDALKAEFPIDAFDCPLVPRGWNREVPITEEMPPVQRFVRSELKRQAEQIASRSLLVSEHCSPGKIDDYSKAALGQGKKSVLDVSEELFMPTDPTACLALRSSDYIYFSNASIIEASDANGPALYDDRASMVAMVNFLGERLEAGVDRSLSEAYKELSDESIIQGSDYEPDLTCLARIELVTKLFFDARWQLTEMLLSNPASSGTILMGLNNVVRSYIRDSTLITMFVNEYPVADISMYLDSMDEIGLVEALKYVENAIGSSASLPPFDSSESEFAKIETLSKTSSNPAVREAMGRLAEKLKSADRSNAEKPDEETGDNNPSEDELEADTE